MKKILGSLVLVGAMVVGAQAQAESGSEISVALSRALTGVAAKNSPCVSFAKKIKKVNLDTTTNAQFASLKELYSKCDDKFLALEDAFLLAGELFGEEEDPDFEDPEEDFDAEVAAPAKGAFLSFGDRFSSAEPVTGPDSPKVDEPAKSDGPMPDGVIDE